VPGVAGLSANVTAILPGRGLGLGRLDDVGGGWLGRGGGVLGGAGQLLLEESDLLGQGDDGLFQGLHLPLQPLTVRTGVGGPGPHHHSSIDAPAGRLSPAVNAHVSRTRPRPHRSPSAWTSGRGLRPRGPSPKAPPGAGRTWQWAGDWWGWPR